MILYSAQDELFCSYAAMILTDSEIEVTEELA